LKVAHSLAELRGERDVWRPLLLWAELPEGAEYPPHRTRCQHGRTAKEGAISMPQRENTVGND